MDGAVETVVERDSGDGCTALDAVEEVDLFEQLRRIYLSQLLP